MKFPFVLGPDSYHMREVEEILAQHNIPYGFAANNGKRLVDTTSEPAHVILPNGKRRKLGKNPVFVGCGQEQPSKTVLQAKDCSAKPGKYWPGSMIGRVIRLLQENGVSIKETQKHRVMAAVEVCLAAAARGECPGISREEVLAHRLHQVVGSEKEVENALNYWENLLSGLRPMARLKGVNIYVVSTHQVARSTLPLVQLAALREGEKGAAVVTLCGDIATLTGNVTAALTTTFFAAWAKANGLAVRGTTSPGFTEAVPLQKDE